MTDPRFPDSDPAVNPAAGAAADPGRVRGARLSVDEPGWERAALERIALAAIREQRATRRWKIFFRFAFLIVFCAIAWGVWSLAGDGPTQSSSRHTALVTLDGEISATGNASAENINSALNAAFADSNTAGVILRCNSPGGSPVQSGIIYNNMRRLRNQYPAKPLYVVVDDMCASGGYYVASAADKIYVDKASIVGSIGVLMEGFGFTSLMDKLGVERRVQKSGDNKDFFDPFAPASDKQKEHAQQMLDQVHAQFVAAVRQGRGKRLKETPDTFSGLFWTGEQGVDMGLADGFGDTDYVAREVIKAQDVVDYTVKENIANRVARKFGASIGNAALHALAGSTGLTLR